MSGQTSITGHHPAYGGRNGATTPSHQSADLRQGAFPIDPSLASQQQQISVTTSSNHSLPSINQFNQPYTRSAAGHELRPQYTTPVYPTESPYAHHQAQATHQSSATDYGGYDTSFVTDGHSSSTQAELQTLTNSTGTGDQESQEIRRLAINALSEPIENLANRTRADENGPNGEKARQILGMSWLMRNCEPAQHATPRNRVYSRYVALCAQERLKPLNPASFGKLVRAVFPDIKTRRLGVRGQSKYHYCGIRLNNDDPTVETPELELEENASHNLNSRPPSIVPSTFEQPTLSPSQNANFLQSTDRLIDRDDLNWLPHIKSTNLRFISHSAAQDIEDRTNAGINFRLPSIVPYVNQQHDPDAVETLSSLYITHATTCIEAIRFVRLKQFLTAIQTFYGSLTAPVQKVMASDAIIPWVQRADFAMYKEIIRILSPLALQIVPISITTHLRTLSQQLPQHVQNAYLPHKVSQLLYAKQIPATAFSKLLTRLLTVNASAHNAARYLASAADREVMRTDWLRFVNVSAIVDRELPCGSDVAQRALGDELLTLLASEDGTANGAAKVEQSIEPAPPPRKRLRNDGLLTTPSSGSRVGPSTFLANLQTSPGVSQTSLSQLPDLTSVDLDHHSDLTSRDVSAQPSTITLDRWAQWLCTLPERFPTIPPKIFLWCMSSVGDSALREITLGEGEGFGAWWTVRCWMDEWMTWVAEKGGFLDMGVELSQEMVEGHAVGVQQGLQGMQYGVFQSL